MCLCAFWNFDSSVYIYASMSLYQFYKLSEYVNGMISKWYTFISLSYCVCRMGKGKEIFETAFQTFYRSSTLKLLVKTQRI